MLVNKKFFLDETIREQVKRTVLDIGALLPNVERHRGAAVSLAAYLLYKVSFYNNSTMIQLSDWEGNIGVEHDTVLAAREFITEDTWSKLVALLARYTPEVFAATVFAPSNDIPSLDEDSTPDSVVRLAKKLLGCGAGEKVADIGCGTGAFLVSAALDEPDGVFTGYEINALSHAVAQIRAELLHAKIDIKLQDVFDAIGDGSIVGSYDKVFSNYPFGLKLRNLGAGTEYLKRLSDDFPGLSKATSSDWVFNSLLCDLLADGGRAVGIMTNGSTWNSIDTPMRKHFVERGMIEAVISLPAKLFSYTNIATSLIILSHGNKDVRLVDATGICRQGRRNNEFSDADIQVITDALKTDGEFSRLVSLQELRDNEYTLSLSRYLASDIVFANGVPFESVIKSISRGAHCTASELDAMASDAVTNMQYLMLANIHDGLIDDKLPYLASIDPQYDRYCLKENDLILSKNGFPYKVAVAAVKNGQRILASGNLYIIEVDIEKADPYYLKAFFESEQGIAALKSITVGATIPNIGVDKLKKLMIPLPSLAEQRQIAQKYRAAQDEIAILKLRLEKAVSRLHHVFDEESEGRDA